MPTIFLISCDQTENWIKTSDHQKLPKTPEKFANTLKGRCGYKCSVGNVERAFQMLQTGGYISCSSDGKVNYLRPTDHPERIKRLKQNRNLSELELVDMKIQEWVYSQETACLPKLQTKLRNSLEHIILIKDEIDPLRVVDHLVAKGVIVVKPGIGSAPDTLEYSK